MTDVFAASRDRVFAVIKEALQPGATSSDDDFVGLLQALRGDSSTETAVADADRSTLELIIRMYMEQCMASARQHGSSMEDAKVPALLDLSIQLAAANIVDPNTPFALFEDLFDAQVISRCEELFLLLEQRAASLSPFLSPPASTPKADTARNMRAKLCFIRTCTELLRRLSKSKNTNFCGRVLLLMAYTLPLCERSGLNIKGQTATSSIDIAPSMADGEEPPAAAAGEGGAATAGGGAVDYDFYQSFWALQKSFSDPNSAMTAEAWPELHARLETVLQVFSAFGGEAAVGSASADPAEVAVIAEEEAVAMDVDSDGTVQSSEALQEVYFAKFLTSPKLIHLQLRDAYFRRHVLVQLQIFIQTIGTERKGAPTLSPEQLLQVEALQTRCTELMRGVAPNGSSFATAVAGVLEREQHWIGWKKAGCQSFDKAAATLKATGKKRSAAAGGGRPTKRLSLGNQELSRLWNLGGNSLQALASSDSKRRVPSLAEYLKPVEEQMDPAAGIEEEYKLKNDKVYTWKALRLMAKKDVSLLAKVAPPNGSIEVAVATLLEKAKGTAPAAAEEPIVATKDEA